VQKYKKSSTFADKMKVNMQKPHHITKRYVLSLLCIVAIWVLCLIPIPDTPLSQVTLIDKWTHFVMYGGLCFVVWAEYGRRHDRINWPHALLWATLMPIVMGALIEIIQAFTGYRSGDWADLVADTIGVALGQLIGIPLAMYLSRRNRG
jgi:VanZ family protein